MRLHDEDRGTKSPLQSFAGEMGVAPREECRIRGSWDTKQLRSKILPIEVEGSLFSKDVGLNHQ